MNDDVEQWLGSRPIESAPKELRPRVLESVHRELDRSGIPSWERALFGLVAASLVFGVGINWWVGRQDAVLEAWLRGATNAPGANDDLLIAARDFPLENSQRTAEARLIDAWRAAHATPAIPLQASIGWEDIRGMKGRP